MLNDWIDVEMYGDTKDYEETMSMIEMTDSFRNMTPKDIGIGAPNKKDRPRLLRVVKYSRRSNKSCKMKP